MLQSQSLTVKPKDNSAISITIGVLNTPSGSCQWEVIYDKYYRLAKSDMSNNNLKCIAFFAPIPVNVNYMIRTVDIDTDDKVYIYSNNNNLQYTMESSDSYSYVTNSFALFYRTDSYLVSGSITVYDQDLFSSPGDYALEVTNNLTLNILPLYYLIVHNSEDFKVTTSKPVTNFQNGSYYFPELSRFVLESLDKARTAYITVIKPPLLDCNRILIYDGFEATFALNASEYSSDCFILSAPYIVDYSLYSMNFTGEVEIYNSNGDYVSNLTSSSGFICRGSTVFFQITFNIEPKEGTVGLQNTQIISAIFENEEFNNNFSTPLTTIQGKTYSGTYNRFITGFYEYYIPKSGSTLNFKRYSLYIFHNPSLFTATGSRYSFLGEGSSVLNITDYDYSATIKPLTDINVLNISVLNYKDLVLFSQCNSVDVVSVSSSLENHFVTSYSSGDFAGKTINFTIQQNQRICIWYASSSPFSISAYSDGLYETNAFIFQLLSKASYSTPYYSSLIHSRAIFSRWTTGDIIDGSDDGGASVSAKKTLQKDVNETGGIFRGTRSYMDFPFANYRDTSNSVLNLGPSESKLNFTTAPTNAPGGLSGVHIFLIVLAVIVVVVVCVVVVCLVHRSNQSKAEMNKKFNSDKGDELSDVEDKETQQTGYMSGTPSPQSSAATTTTGHNSATSTVNSTGVVPADPNLRVWNPYEISPTTTTNEK
ncbi:hypothetical protein TVAG_405960 [Trichomonas vaginalis G3]|uniref:Transmembrane protein n=1 Tax=Trichomonas vaginalis (strain ATCC PRA-98 / G3) TaxID=412133 RepID=A2DV86_TRIV3|nr:hypothetical protein TVAGG3_0631170 [Trichomonas vaginalis G3]EAY15682.1 hypothetical protein TVAG_405960 [Trichomonas vaginalis G3]KAI5504532.1 hypothetical protein TVAGG3_0631170 [Trichomonas vaginalis G3]|eukprot:XP_001327905.1 hypothetical protein [Trichomonas vaginalis G3]